MSAGMVARGRGPGHGRLLAVLAGLTVLVHLYGLYRPSAGSPPLFSYADKVQHLVGFAVPVALVLLAAQLSAGRRLRRSGSASTALVVALFGLNAVTSELAQHYFYRNRTGDVTDALADALGIALGWAVARRLARPRSFSGLGPELPARAP